MRQLEMTGKPFCCHAIGQRLFMEENRVFGTKKTTTRTVMVALCKKGFSLSSAASAMTVSECRPADQFMQAGMPVADITQ